MAQRHVELLIGRLITDEAFRMDFEGDPEGTLLRFVEGGHELTAVEIDALRAIGCELWEQVASRIDPRLLKVTLPRA